MQRGQQESVDGAWVLAALGRTDELTLRSIVRRARRCGTTAHGGSLQAISSAPRRSTPRSVRARTRRMHGCAPPNSSSGPATGPKRTRSSESRCLFFARVGATAWRPRRARRCSPPPPRAAAAEARQRVAALLDQSGMPAVQRPGALDAVGGSTLAATAARAPLSQIVTTGRPLSELVGEGAHEPVRDVPAARDVALVALVLLADVEHLDRAVREQRARAPRCRSGSSVSGARPSRKSRRASSRPTARNRARGRLGLLGRRRVDRDRLLGVEHEARLGRRMRSRRAGRSARPQVTGRELVRRSGRRAPGRVGSSSCSSGGCAPTKGPRLSATMRSMVGGRGAEIAACAATNSSSPGTRARGSFQLARADRRRASELIPAPQSEPATWPGSTSSRRGGRPGAAANANSPRAPSRASTARSGRGRVADQQRVAVISRWPSTRKQSAPGGARACAGRGSPREPTATLRRPRAARTGTRARRSDGSTPECRARAPAGRVRRGDRRGCASRARARLHAAALRLREVRLDGVRRVDEHGLACFLVTDQIGRAAEVVIHELPKEHCLTLSGRPAAFPGCARADLRTSAKSNEEAHVEAAEPRREFLISKAWIQAVVLVVLCGFFVLGLLAYRTYMAHPPVPARVVDGERDRALHRPRHQPGPAGLPAQGADGVRLSFRPRGVPRPGLHRRLPPTLGEPLPRLLRRPVLGLCRGQRRSRTCGRTATTRRPARSR